MAQSNQRKPEGGIGLAGIAAAVLTIAVAVLALALAVQARSHFPTWQALASSGPDRPYDVSKSGHLGDWLFDVTTYGVTLLFVIMVGILLWAVFNHREGKNKPHYEHGIGRHHLVLTAVISSLIFFGIDGTLLYNSFADLHSDFYNFPTEGEKPLTVEVMAQQWAWNFRYPGPDGKFNTADDIVEFNEMHIPVGKPVLIRLQSKDVIHSFYLPNFPHQAGRRSRDDDAALVPGHAARRLRHRVRPALRRQPLQDARPARHRHARGLRPLGEGRSRRGDAPLRPDRRRGPLGLGLGVLALTAACPEKRQDDE